MHKVIKINFNLVKTIISKNQIEIVSKHYSPGTISIHLSFDNEFSQKSAPHVR